MAQEGEHESLLHHDRRKGDDGPLDSPHLGRYLSFCCAMLSCLCAGSITAYSLYAPLFLSRLHYSQLEVNAVSIAAELSMYLLVPVFGYLCDRYSPRVISALSSLFFGAGYLLAAFTYRRGPAGAAGGQGWPVAAMAVAFVGVGAGTACMYLSAVTTCAKNFGRGKYRGLALGVPIAAFGLGGMWQSQIGTRVLYEKGADAVAGEVDVFKFFVFLSVLLFVVGLVGAVGLRVVDEGEEEDEDDEEDEEVDEPAGVARSDGPHASYGSVQAGSSDVEQRVLSSSSSSSSSSAPASSSSSSFSSSSSSSSMKCGMSRPWRSWISGLFNSHTREFLSDPTVWWLAGGFFLVAGPGEAFINNLGTIIGTLTPPDPASDPASDSAASTTPATHISIIAVTSTLARILTGLLCDLFAPPSRPPTPPSPSPPSSPSPPPPPRRLHLSRIPLLLLSALLLSTGQVFLASGLVQSYPDRFWLVSALIGSGYGAIFSLAPIICSVVWGLAHFGSNWGLVAVVPAFGATFWGVVYSAVYQWAAAAAAGAPGGGGTGGGGGGGGAGGGGAAGGGHESRLCYGQACYASTFAAMAVSAWLACAMWLWAWRGPNGWRRRGTAV
ncbi:MAG: putative monocarboxylate transporter mch1 [Phylliscum demangeonii]|nr:MAG: putative monocarboxylate transporter mch1 [Phylliscum demangeonii]